MKDNPEEVLKYAMYALTEMMALVRAIDGNEKNHSEYQVAKKAEQKIVDYLNSNRSK